MNEETTSQLFRRFQASRDQDALGELFDALAPNLLARARATVPEAAEDLVQTTFLALIEAAPRFDPERRFLPWARGILDKVIVMEKRRVARRVDRERLEKLAARSAASTAATDETLRLVAHHTARLPTLYRGVVMLSISRGLEPDEIATVLDRPANRVRVQLHRGLRLLRRRLPAGALSARVLPLWGHDLATHRASLVDWAAASPRAETLGESIAWGWVASIAAAGVLAYVLTLPGDTPSEPMNTSIPADVAESGGDPAPRSQPPTAPAEEGARTNVNSTAASNADPRTTELRPVVGTRFVDDQPPAGVLTRRVIDARGRPIAGVALSAYVPAGKPALPPGGGFLRYNVAEVVTNDDGIARFPGLAEKARKVRDAMAGLGHPSERVCELMVNEPVHPRVVERFPLNAVPTNARDLVLAGELGWLEVVVRGGVFVQLTNTITASVGDTRSNLSMSKELRRGRARWLVGAGRRFHVHLQGLRGGRPDPIAGPSAVGETKTVGFSLDGKLRVEARLVDPSGRPITGAEARLAIEDDGSPGAPYAVILATTDADGRLAGWYKADEIGHLRMRLDARRNLQVFTIPSRSLHIRSPYRDIELGDIVVRARPLIAAGRCIDDRERPVPGARIQVNCVNQEGDTWHEHVTTFADDDGRFRVHGDCHSSFNGLRAVAGNGDRSARVRFAPAATSIEVVIPRSGSVRGRVIAPAGTSLKSLFIGLDHPNQQSSMGGSYLVDDTVSEEGTHVRDWTPLAADGTFTITGLYPGRLSVLVASDKKGSNEYEVLKEIRGVVVPAGQRAADPRLHAITLP